MKITLILVSKSDAGPVRTLMDLYSQRISKYCSFSIKEITTKDSYSTQQKQETDAILKNIQSSDFVVLLDEKGKQFSSVEFSGFLAKHQLISTKHLVFIIGGAYGFSEAIYNRANFKLSVSSMTFPHQIARIIFAEQLYRAFTILKREKYHH